MNNFNNNLSAISINKSILKEYFNNRTVYMNDGTEFEIMLFNPYTFTVAVSIYFDGEKIPNQLIIKPGQRIWLDSFLHTNKRFKFNTYEVEDSIEAKNATAKNGLVDIKFYKENSNKNVMITDSPITRSNITWTTNDIPTTCGADSWISTASNGISNLGISNKNEASINANYCYNAKTIETGRIEEGSLSNTDFYTVNKEFENYPFKTESFRILPMSQKMFTKSDVSKKYCYNCGKKLNTKYKYCPQCGTKVE